MGYSPGLLLEADFRHEFTLNLHKQSRKQSQIFRTMRIPRTCQNRRCSKPWAITQAFCSKSADFRPLRIHPKSTQTVAQAVTNHFRTVLEAFQRVWSDFQDLPKSAMFKTMGYSPGLLLEIGQFSTSTKFIISGQKQSRKQSQIILERFWRRFRGFRVISRTCQNRPCSKPWAIAQAFCSRNRPIFDPYEFTLNRHKQSRKQSQIILERFWRRFREFGAISRTCQNRPCSKPWAIAQAFCSKSADFRPLRIHPKSTQTVAQAVTNHFRTVLEAFQRVWSDFQDLPKSAMFKTMGYSPGLLLEIGQFSTSTNSP